MKPQISPSDFLRPGHFIDSDAEPVRSFAAESAGDSGSDIDRALRLFMAVRDGIVYDPYLDFGDAANYRASSVLGAGRGFCVGKAALLAACARAAQIPARVGYADVKNHLTSRRLYELTRTDVFRWHSYTELWLAGRWVKATPAFDLALCERVGLKPLDFDGRSDSLFHPFDRAGRRHMEYLTERGTYGDVPFDTIVADFRVSYPTLMMSKPLTGDFRSEAQADVPRR